MVRPWVSKLVGWFAKTKWSCRYIAPFIKRFSIKIEDFVEPVGGYKSFNDFFIRALNPGVRFIDSEEQSLVAPADSKLFVIEEIAQDQSFFIKDTKFTLAAFLQDDELAKSYEHGSMLIFRLAPYDYHRFHFPTHSIVEYSKSIAGVLGSVNPLAYRAHKQPLIENQRIIISLRSVEFGNLLAIPVGALFVGAIKQTFSLGTMHKKGDELGFFEYGGSTLVLFFKPGIFQVNPIFLKHSREGFETEVLMGQSIGKKVTLIGG